MSTLYEQLIRLGEIKPELRSDLRPILARIVNSIPEDELADLIRSVDKALNRRGPEAPRGHQYMSGDGIRFDIYPEDLSREYSASQLESLLKKAARKHGKHIQRIYLKPIEDYYEAWIKFKDTISQDVFRNQRGFIQKHRLR